MASVSSWGYSHIVLLTKVVDMGAQGVILVMTVIMVDR